MKKNSAKGGSLPGGRNALGGKKIKSMGFHDKLMRKEGAYAKWHRHPFQTLVQWLFLLAIVGGVGYLLINRMNDPYAENYGLSSEASGDVPNLFLGYAEEREKSRFGISAEETDADIEKVEKGSKKLRVKLPEDRTVIISLKSLEKRGQGNTVWRGSVEGQADSSSVTLTLKNGFVAGSIHIGMDLYEIRPTKDGKYIVEKMDPNAFPPEKEADLGSASNDVSSQTTPTSGSANDTGTVQIDILSVYTPQVLSAYGGSAQVDAFIQSAIDSANTAFINSQVNIHYNLVATAGVSHNDAGSTGADLTWAMSDPGVASLRNQYGADMVTIFDVNSPSSCGTAYGFNTIESYAFAAVDKDCAVANLTFAHEHGHNLGMGHNSADAGGSYYSYSYAYGVDGVFRTVMAYPYYPEGGLYGYNAPRVPYFSNPNVMYSGYPTGITNQNDNARTANINALIVAGFRGAPTPATIPFAPGSLSATAISSSQINLAWADNSPDESGFKIERSTDGTNFSQIGTTGANVSNYSNTGLSVSTTYYYRVKAYNSAGESGPSDFSSATTQAQDTTPPTVNITSPANNARVSGNVNVSVAASDNAGVSRVEFYIDGVRKATDSSAPYSYKWNANKQVPAGAHTITAKAFDAAGNNASASVTVTK